jgi:hypothetical protein
MAVRFAALVGTEADALFHMQAEAAPIFATRSRKAAA